VSVPSNIAEGYGRHSTPEYIHHLRFSNGSNNELQTQIELARRVEIITVNEASTLMADAEEIGRMLQGLIRSLELRR
jgi:four helix bundle protein